MRRAARALRIGLLLIVAATAAAGAAEPAPLPPPECVRMLRDARLAGMRGDATDEIEILRAARRRFPAELAPLHALLELHRRQPLPDAERQELQATLAERLEDPEGGLPLAMLQRLAVDDGLGEGLLALILAQLERRVGDPAEADFETLELKAELEQRLGKLEAAAATLEELWRRTPTVGLPLVELYTELERWPDVARVLRSMIDDGARALRGRYVLALSRAGAVDELLRQIDVWAGEEVGMMQGEPSTRELLDIETLGRWLTLAAWNLRDAGRDEDAERLFRRLLRADPENAEARAALLYLYASAEEQADEAAALAQRWEQETDARTLFDEGTQRLTSGDAAGAIELLRRAAPQLPDLEAAWYNLGLAAYRLEEWDTAESALGRAAELNPERADTVFFRGLALVELGRCADAIGALEQALALDPERTLAHYHLYRCYQDLGDTAAASRHFALYHDSQRQ